MVYIFELFTNIIHKNFRNLEKLGPITFIFLLPNGFKINFKKGNNAQCCLSILICVSHQFQSYECCKEDRSIFRFSLKNNSILTTPPSLFTAEELMELLRNKRVTFIGDSLTEQLFYGLITQLVR